MISRFFGEICVIKCSSFRVKVLYQIVITGKNSIITSKRFFSVTDDWKYLIYNIDLSHYKLIQQFENMKYSV